MDSIERSTAEPRAPAPASARDATPAGPLSGRSRLVTARAVLLAVAVSALGVLPALLLGALAVQIREDLGVGPGLLGLAATVLFTVTAALVRLGGLLVQRSGVRVGASVAVLLSITALTVIATAPSAAWLMVGLAVGGMGNAVAAPLANHVISQFVTERHLGLAFGIKQASVPAATLLGGLAVPGIALVFGWRWAVVAAIGVAIAVLLSLFTGGGGAAPRGSFDEDRTADRGIPRGGLVVLTIGGFFGSAAATPVGVFLVDSAVANGLGPGAAGFLFAVCSVLGFVSRVGFGWLADRHPTRSRYVFIANLLLGGAVGYGLLAAGGVPLTVLGSMAGYVLGWAWPGLFHLAVIRDNRSSAASVTGFVQTGLSLGAASGPLVFGLLAQTSGYRGAWIFAAVLSLLSGLTVRVARRMVRRSRGLVTRLTGPRGPLEEEHR